MNEFQHDETMIMSVGLVILIALSSLWLWGKDVSNWKNRRNAIRCEKLTPWSTSWLNFSLIIWIACIVFILITILFQKLLLPDQPPVSIESAADAITWPVLIFGLSIQFALLISVVVARLGYQLSFFDRPASLGFLKTFGLSFSWIIRVLPILWITAFASEWLFQLLGLDTNQQETVSTLLKMEDPMMFLFSAFVAVIIAPLCEELFFRGIVFRFLLGKLSKVSALIISAFFFSALHFNLDSLIPIFILGIALGGIYLRTGNIKTSIYMHMIFNFHTILIISLDKWAF